MHCGIWEVQEHRKRFQNKSQKHKKFLMVKKEELTASGIPRFHNQVCWARQYLVWEGYIESSKRGVWTLSSTGTKKYLSDEEAKQIFLKS